MTDLEALRAALDELFAEVGRMRDETPKLIRHLMDDRDQAVALVADMVVKATEYGTQDGDFVAAYLLPTGPIHRAIPWLQEHGRTVRPGFDGDRPTSLSPDQCPPPEEETPQ